MEKQEPKEGSWEMAPEVQMAFYDEIGRCLGVRSVKSLVPEYTAIENAQKQHPELAAQAASIRPAYPKKAV